MSDIVDAIALAMETMSAHTHASAKGPAAVPVEVASAAEFAERFGKPKGKTLVEVFTESGMITADDPVPDHKFSNPTAGDHIRRGRAKDGLVYGVFKGGLLIAGPFDEVVEAEGFLDRRKQEVLRLLHDQASRPGVHVHHVKDLKIDISGVGISGIGSRSLPPIDTTRPIFKERSEPITLTKEATVEDLGALRKWMGIDPAIVDVAT